jgi:hypothetical protein
MNTNTDTHTNPDFYAVFDNDHLPRILNEDKARQIKELSANPPPFLKGALGFDILYIDHPTTHTAVLVYRVPKNHRIIAYGSRIINPNTGKREAVFISECPETKELWFSMDRDDLNPVTQAYWIDDNLCVSSYLRYVGGCIAKKTLISHEKLTVKQETEATNGTVSYTSAKGPVFRTRIDGIDTWELPLPNGGTRTLRTVNPSEGR